MIICNNTSDAIDSREHPKFNAWHDIGVVEIIGVLTVVLLAGDAVNVLLISCACPAIVLMDNGKCCFLHICNLVVSATLNNVVLWSPRSV